MPAQSAVDREIAEAAHQHLKTLFELCKSILPLTDIQLRMLRSLMPEDTLSSLRQFPAAQSMAKAALDAADALLPDEQIDIGRFTAPNAHTLVYRLSKDMAALLLCGVRSANCGEVPDVPESLASLLDASTERLTVWQIGHWLSLSSWPSPQEMTRLKDALKREHRQAISTLRAPEPNSGEVGGTGAMQKALAVYTSGVSDERIVQVAEIVGDSKKTVQERLAAMDKLIAIPASTSSRALGKALGVSHEAVRSTDWWKANRAGKGEATAERRLEQHKRRAAES